MTNNSEIIQISDTEFSIGENRLSLIDKNIIYVIAQGEITTEIALLHKKVCTIISTGVEGKINYLINLNKCGKNSPEARKTWHELTASEQTYKVATFGLNPVARVIASFVIGTLKTGNLRFFKTKEEAVSWIQS